MRTYELRAYTLSSREALDSFPPLTVTTYDSPPRRSSAPPPRRSTGPSQHRARRPLDEAGDTEVGQPRPPGFVEQNVARLDVSSAAPSTFPLSVSTGG